MTPLNSVVKNGNGYAFAGESGQPGLLHVHVQPVATVQVPQLRPSGKERRTFFSFFSFVTINLTECHFIFLFLRNLRNVSEKEDDYFVLLHVIYF